MPDQNTRTWIALEQCGPGSARHIQAEKPDSTLCEQAPAYPRKYKRIHQVDLGLFYPCLACITEDVENG